MDFKFSTNVSIEVQMMKVESWGGIKKWNNSQKLAQITVAMPSAIMLEFKNKINCLVSDKSGKADITEEAYQSCKNVAIKLLQSYGSQSRPYDEFFSENVEQ